MGFDLLILMIQMVARPIFSEIHFIFVSNFRDKALVFARDFGQEFFSESIFSIVVPGIVVVLVVAAVTIGRRAGKKYNYPLCGQQFHNENRFFFPL